APVKRHEWIDPQGAALRPRRGVMVAVAALERRDDGARDDARMVGHGLEDRPRRLGIALRLGHVRRQRKRPEEAAGLDELGDRFEKMRMANAVVVIDPEAEANEK